MLVLRVRCVDDGRELLVERHGADEHSCFVLLRGQILADADVVDLNALCPSDFFLVDMGFSSELAAQALRQSGNNLLDAAALLAEGRVMHDESMTTLRELAATDSFQALTLLKEQFSSETLNQLNENPVATLRLLSLPLTEMGFARDLVEVMYESCDGDEQATANALLQTLES
ncbi:hypothetical protein PHYSODRAFT_561334 [Phytophthora sojae]|uniref:UBA domain-containing protein n=1 Tax=Phytophthora sojae (strain P6497) TaxID=1094619 RepID=G4ZL72_PHYSP|nr:hypothetical protein PHYSODRAFT_561334 [Phytophthora sojae]EGZ15586.1 hypothetical protein PHYSODRAFT_561334 [Phytophthora sojae]|eukprot:XP_009529335.1 hypothetical protein PHYSODRAFT_561334 [Phytophthora sojae]